MYKMSFFFKDEDLDKPVRTFNYLKKGEGKSKGGVGGGIAGVVRSCAAGGPRGGVLGGDFLKKGTAVTKKGG